VAGIAWVIGADLGDVDHDGWLDLVTSGFPMSGSYVDHSVLVSRGSASGFADTGSFVATGDTSLVRPVLADMTVDGDLDIVNEAGTIIPGNGDGTFGAPSGFDFYLPNLQVVDFDKDGLPDIAGPSSDGGFEILLNQHRDSNQAPSVSLGNDFTVRYRDQFGDGEVELWAQGTDPDLHRLSYKWYDAEGTLLVDCTCPYYEPPATNPGQHVYTVEASDGRGGVARDSMVLTVLPEKDVVIHPGSATQWTEGAWSPVPDASAADGVKMHDRNDGAPKVTAPLASPASYADVKFVADPTQTYKLWVRLKADGDFYGNDSVWLQFSGAVDANGRAYEPGTTSGIEVVLEECSGCGLSGWGWRDEAWGHAGAVGTITLRFPEGGEQTLRLQTREDGVSVDQVVLSSDTYRATRPGTVKNDTTILPASRF
jgi:hypothetical protein